MVCSYPDAVQRIFLSHLYQLTGRQMQAESPLIFLIYEEVKVQNGEGKK